MSPPVVPLPMATGGLRHPQHLQEMAGRPRATKLLAAKGVTKEKAENGRARNDKTSPPPPAERKEAEEEEEEELPSVDDESSSDGAGTGESDGEEMEDGTVGESEEEEGVADGDEEDSVLDSEEEEEFEDQGSSSDESEVLEAQAEASGGEDGDTDDDVEYLESSDEGDRERDEALRVEEATPRRWQPAASQAPLRALLRQGIPKGVEGTSTGRKRAEEIEVERASGRLAVAAAMHADDLSSDDEGEGEGRVRNAIGRVPLHWYDEYEHMGYDLQGKKVMRGRKGDGLDAALASRDDPNYGRTVYDAVNDRHVVLTDRDLEIIRRLQKGAFAHPEHEAYPPQVDVYCDEENIFGPSAPEPKRRFVPSKWELMKVTQMVKAIKEGRMVVGPPPAAMQASHKEAQRQVYLLWKEEEGEGEEGRSRKGPRHIPAPKLPLPGHAESYNPPDEYLLSPEEEQKWREMDPEDRPLPFLPKKFPSLRAVGAYAGFVKERFERCLDLYLCPRAVKKSPTVEAATLLPSLPNPQDLRPFPNSKAVVYMHAKAGTEGPGDGGRVRAIAVSPDGQYMASGGEDGRVCLWEVASGYCLRTWELRRKDEAEGGAQVLGLVWNPHRAHHVLAVAGGRAGVFILRTRTGGEEEEAMTEALLSSGLEGSRGGKAGTGVVWQAYQAGAEGQGGGEGGDGLVLGMEGGGSVTDVRWHGKGDYLASLVPTAGGKAVMIHQISRGKTQCPFKKTHGQVQAVAFHPHKPFFFLATQTHVRVYHLVKQVLMKKLLSGCKWISSLDIHPTGDHVLVSSYDRRVVWFDLDLSSLPYKTLKYHSKAVRAVAFHRSYPLMASGADDGTVHVFHATVYDDLMQNPLVVPVKILRGHAVVGEVGVMALAFHPTQPWVFSGGADGKVVLYQDAF